MRPRCPVHSNHPPKKRVPIRRGRARCRGEREVIHWWVNVRLGLAVLIEQLWVLSGQSLDGRLA